MFRWNGNTSRRFGGADAGRCVCLVAPATRTNAHVGPDTTSLRSRSLHEADPPTPAKPALRTASGLYLLHQHRRAWPAAAPLPTPRNN